MIDYTGRAWVEPRWAEKRENIWIQDLDENSPWAGWIR